MIHIGGQKIALPTCTGRDHESNSEARGGTEGEGEVKRGVAALC